MPLWMPYKQKKINEEIGHLAEIDKMLNVITARLGIHVLSLKCGLVAVPNKVILTDKIQALKRPTNNIKKNIQEQTEEFRQVLTSPLNNEMEER